MYQQMTSQPPVFHFHYNYFMLFKVCYDKEIHILKSANAKTLQELKASIPKVFKAFPPHFYLCYLDEDADQITLATEGDFKILLATAARSAKIIIKEKSEEFYDQTQRIQIEEEPNYQIQALIENDSKFNQASVIHPPPINDKSLDESIDQKLKSILPGIVSKIKQELTQQLLNSSKASQLKTDVSKTQSKKSEELKVVHSDYTCDGCQKHDIEGIRYKCAVCHDFDFCQSCEANKEHPHPFLKIRHPSKAPVKIFVILRDQEHSFEVNGQRVDPSGLSNMINSGLNFAQQFMGQFQQKSSPSMTQTTKEPQVKEEKKVQTKPQPKMETKPVSKVETKPEPKIEARQQPKVQPKVEIKPVRPVEVKQTINPIQKRQQSDKKERQQKIIENANYLSNILEVNFTKCYVFAEKNEHISKEALLEKYIKERPF